MAKSDLMTATVAPFLPWVIGGAVLYFFGGKIASLLGGKLAGISTEQYEADMKTVATAASAPLETAVSIVKQITGTTGYISQADQKAALARIAAVQQAVKLPYPNPASLAEFRANIAAIAAAKGILR